MMKNILFYSLFIWSGIFITGCDQSIDSSKSYGLRFREDKTFIIAQFTDIHWSNSSPKCHETLMSIHSVLTEEKPDLVILTGDIVTDDPSKKGWARIAKVFEKNQVKWTVVLGNHDSEPDIKRAEIFNYLKTKPFFIGEVGNVTGVGNFDLPIIGSSSDKVEAVVYCMDSNEYGINPKITDYDWIHYDQIEWYRNLSDSYRQTNGDRAIPSLAFFHIPLPEYKELLSDSLKVGLQYEGVASSDLNSGLFTSMIEKQDVMGVFVGHDHNNNFIGVYKGVGLGYGQRSGADSYGKIPIGGRIIRLNEGSFSYDSWIRTHKGRDFMFHYPSGMPSITDTTEVLSSMNPGDVVNGIYYRYYEGQFENVSSIDSGQLKGKGVLPNFGIDKALVKDYYGFVFEGWIKIPHRAFYRFYTYTDDGSVLTIDDCVVVNNDGAHGVVRRDGLVALDAGYHKIRLEYFESYMGQKLDVGMSSVYSSEMVIPDNMLYVKRSE
ncbi:metallophosphoesterase [Halosquirtibacter xylanolyticus]|uniref:metallophosphoesterase n=1 Tax=Halosquirtibacter xylanolyticus TaxID=3374599 RepID=UPI00374A00EF|nr:metallophosphoesterase [Prolixibacteraceae bacterium]